MPISRPMARPMPAEIEKPMTMRSNVALMLGQSNPSSPNSTSRLATSNGAGNR